ncbi:RHS repeat-associated core domain-containing protein [Pseudomonas sp. TTU2014-080ASC]|uniref:RHS repeat-associated core domain-containing protein n=1 Tax=Pseudomonas sp. TTU2014-080ASC TaxID=1729724 RepID=UPI00071852D9|nr:RHS repeat-associated core domain-containing protein [Pseudomonas sp. TTU2014-080ASC]KRW62032.1 sugar-binding protein [Pseudomonas sp. TTU2014-080ASC]
MNILRLISLLSLIITASTGSALSHAADRSWSYTYNSLGLIETANGPRTDVSDVTTYAYDAQGRLTQVTNALGHTTQLSNFDALGNPQTVVDANSVTTTLTYSPQGWLTSSTTAGSTTSFEHDAIGQITKVIRGDGSWLQYTWSAARRLTKITNNLGESVEYDYDAMGNRTAQRLKDASSTLTQQQSWVYDELGRLLRSIGAASQTTQFGYDLNDNPTLSTTPKSQSTTSSYDALDRLVSSTDPLNGVSALSYDAQDNLTQVTDPRGVVTQYEYDGLGNLTKQISPDSGTTLYSHDAAGNVISKTDARGVVTTYTYDALNRLTHKQYPATPALNVQYSYDMTSNGNYGIGRLTAQQDASGLIGYQYDARGNLIEQIRSVQVAGNSTYDSLTYAYDAANQLTGITYPAGFAVQFPRNAGGQVTAVNIVIGQQPPASFASGLSYAPFGPLKSLSWANGLTLTRTYDQDYRLTQQNVGTTWQASYSYDANSNIQTLQSGMFGDLAYDYDALDRLTKEEHSSGRQEYAYDAVGNRTGKTVTELDSNGQPLSSTATALSYATNSNRLTAIDSQPVTSDAAGNLTQDRATRQLEYDAQGRLSKVRISGNVVAEYSYNALGQRTHKITSSGITTFLYGPDGQLLGETHYTNTGTKLSSQYYLWLDSMPIGGLSINYDALGAVTSTTAFYLHADHLNTPRLATNHAGQEVWRWKSNAFGEGSAVEAPGSGLSAINLRFPGQYYDSESGLYYNYFRDYDPQTGRYVESDPMGLKAGLNTYGYVLGNPHRYTDPRGLSVLTAPGAEAGAAAGTAICPGVGTLVGGVIGAGIGAGLSWYLGDKLFNESSDQPDNPPSVPKDPTQPPGEGWEWRGKGTPGSREGAWYNPSSGESLHDDRTHPPGKDPHVTYTDPTGKRWDNYGNGWTPQ